MNKSIQFFSKEYLKRCEGVTPDQIIEFLENYRMLFSSAQAKSQSIRGAICKTKVAESFPKDLNGNLNRSK